ncbi:MAG: insulinase family protein [Veillonella parvula]
MFSGKWDSSGYVAADCLPATYVPTVLTIDKDVEQIHMCFTFTEAPKRDSKHRYSLAVLNTLFGGGMSSRLFQKVRREEEGLAYIRFTVTLRHTAIREL